MVKGTGLPLRIRFKNLRLLQPSSLPQYRRTIGLAGIRHLHPRALASDVSGKARRSRPIDSWHSLRLIYSLPAFTTSRDLPSDLRRNRRRARPPEGERTSDGFISCGSAKPWEIASGWLAGPFVIETAKRFCFLRLVSSGEPYPSRLWSTPPLDDMDDNALPSRQTANKGFFEG
jgi:hypothetical protein